MPRGALAIAILALAIPRPDAGPVADVPIRLPADPEAVMVGLEYRGGGPHAFGREPVPYLVAHW